MTKKKIEPLLYETYLSVVAGSVQTDMFRHLFSLVDGHKEDITRDGDLSCAFYVSAILVIFGLVKRVHGTVRGTVRDMKMSGWYPVSSPRPGAVLVWKPRVSDRGEMHGHIGFAVSSEEAVSNSAKARVPVRHPISYWVDGDESPRKLEAVYWHSSLDGGVG